MAVVGEETSKILAWNLGRGCLTEAEFQAESKQRRTFAISFEQAGDPLFLLKFAPLYREDFVRG